MLSNIQPRGSRLMIRPAASTGRAEVITGITAILSITALLKNEPSGLFAAIKSIAWLVYFLWIVVVFVELIRRPVREG